MGSCSPVLWVQRSDASAQDAATVQDGAVQDANVPVDGRTYADAAAVDSASPDAAAQSDSAANHSIDAAAQTDAAISSTCQNAPDCDDGLGCTDDDCAAGQCFSQPNSDCAWPAEATGDAENLTGLGGTLLDNPFGRDLSGASWNPQTRELWICRNNGPSMVWLLRQGEDGEFYIPSQGDQRAEWSDFGDAEGLSLADFSQPNSLYVIQEGVNEIVQYDLSVYGQKTELHRWHTGADMPASGNTGAEGIAFVPNSVLQRSQAVDDQGQPLRASQGLDGIMLVAHQNGGGVYAFDLKPSDDSYVFRGRFDTGHDESAGLEVDRDAGLLYIWHGASYNALEVTRLSSTPDGSRRVLDRVAMFSGIQAPLIGGDNFEGVALEPLGACHDGRRSLFMTIDGGHNQSLYRYRDFICPPWGP